MSARSRRLGGAVALLFAVSAALPVANADSIADKQRQAQQIADNIERLGEKAANLGETWNGAQLKLQQAQADVKDAETKLNSLEAKLGTVRSSRSSSQSLRPTRRAIEFLERFISLFLKCVAEAIAPTLWLESLAKYTSSWPTIPRKSA